jgi:hypothetical protein
VWDRILREIIHDPENGKGNIMDLMNKIRLGLLVTVFSSTMQWITLMWRKNDECREMILRVLQLLRDFE